MVSISTLSWNDFMSTSLRYQGRPLLRLLECYVLQAIDMLSEHDAEHLKTLEPQLERSLGHQGRWSQIVEASLDLPPNMPQLIASAWRENLQIANANQVELRPQEFAEMFVDANLA